MQDLVFDGITYVTSKRAAEITGYAKDYIGQLCREGRVDARLVGRSWYVSEVSIRAHRFGEEVETEMETVESPVEVIEEEPAPEVLEEEVAEMEPEPAWETATYIPEEIDVLPSLVAKKEPVSDIANITNTQTEIVRSDVRTTNTQATEMQSAWQDWFQKKSSTEVKESETPHEVHIEKIISPEIQESRNYDIRPTPQFVSLPMREDTKTVERAGSPKKGKTDLIWKALFSGFILITISLTVIASGFTEDFAKKGIFGDFIMFLGGTSVVEK